MPQAKAPKPTAEEREAQRQALKKARLGKALRANLGRRKERTDEPPSDPETEK